MVLNFWLPGHAVYDGDSRAQGAGGEFEGQSRWDSTRRRPDLNREAFRRSARSTTRLQLALRNCFQQFNGVGIPYTLVLDPSQRIVKIYHRSNRPRIARSGLKTINDSL